MLDSRPLNMSFTVPTLSPFISFGKLLIFQDPGFTVISSLMLSLTPTVSCSLLQVPMESPKCWLSC